VTSNLDIIGDVHGQYDKLVALLEHLGYSKYRLPQEVATDEVREASRARAPDSPVSGEGMDTRTARPDEAYRHPSRSVIFVGDLIDRGPRQLATVDLVRRMVEAGSARCVMGNHEFNAIAWATPNPENPGEFLRPHGKKGNLQQHQAFLSEVEGSTAFRCGPSSSSTA